MREKKRLTLIYSFIYFDRLPPRRLPLHQLLRSLPPPTTAMVPLSRQQLCMLHLPSHWVCKLIVINDRGPTGLCSVVVDLGDPPTLPSVIQFKLFILKKRVKIA